MANPTLRLVYLLAKFGPFYLTVYNLSKIQQALALIKEKKEKADKVKALKETGMYKEWLKSDEGKAFKREAWEMQPDYEEVEE